MPPPSTPTDAAAPPGTTSTSHSPLKRSPVKMYPSETTTRPPLPASSGSEKMGVIAPDFRNATMSSCQLAAVPMSSSPDPVHTASVVRS